MDAASHFHSNYSTNGHSPQPFVATKSGATGESDSQTSAQKSDTLTLPLTREEAEFIFERRREAFQRDPGAPPITNNKERINSEQADTDIRPEWKPIPMSQLTSDRETLPWLWDGYIAKGCKTSFTGIWKSGKTTLLKYLMKSMDGSATEFCGLPVAAARILIVSEESKRLWADRRDELGLLDHIDLIALPFKVRPPLGEWIRFMAWLEKVNADENYDLIVFDSMHNLWGVTDENKNAEVLGYLMPLNSLTEQGAALLLIAHPSKGDAGEGRATRGGGAWGGFVDLILEMRRHDADNREDTRRTLSAYSRWEGTPGQLVIELDKEKGQYSVVGTKADASAQDRMGVYVRLLSKKEQGMTPEEIYEEWPNCSITKPGTKTISRDLERAVNDGTIRQRGAGKKGDPKRYSMLDTIEA